MTTRATAGRINVWRNSNSFFLFTEKKMPKGHRSSSSNKSDCAKVKRPMSAYMYFVQKNRAEIKSQNPEMTFGQLGALVAQKWRALTETDKKLYVDLATADKKRYESEK